MPKALYLGPTIPLHPLMYWILIALLALACKTGMGYYQKLFMNDNFSALKVGFAWTVIGALFFVPAAGYDIATNSYNLTQYTILILFGIGSLEVLKSVIGLKALEAADLSLVTPIRKSYVVGLALVEPLVFAVSYNIYIILSTGLVVIGLFITMSDTHKTHFETIATLKERGPLLAILSGGIGILLALGSRFGATEFSPITFGGFIYLSLAIGYVIWIRVEEKEIPLYVLRNPKFLGLGALAVAQSFFTWTTFSLVSATVASTVFQLTVVTSTIVGGLVLKESNSWRRIIGSLVILIGVLITAHLGT